jgi:hypothetical protein
VSFQPRKSTKTTNNLVICDNKRNILAISKNIAGNHHDNYEIEAHFEQMTSHFEAQNLIKSGQYLNADAGFDSNKFRQLLIKKGFIPNIDINKRNSKTNDNQPFIDRKIYKNRFKIEQVFGYLDTYKRARTRDDALSACFQSWLFCATFLHNVRKIY